MKTTVPWIVAMLAILIAPGALAAERAPQEYVDDVVKSVIPPINACQWLIPGDQVGYKPGGFDYLPLGGGLHTAKDIHYLAYGIFSGGDEVDVGGTRYLVFTILSGFSGSSDWCDHFLGPAAEPAQKPEP